MKLTPHFTLEELTISEAAARGGWDNTPGPMEQANLVRVAELLEKVRGLFLSPIIVTSGYRSKKVNDAVGSKDSSQHRLGCAADIRIVGYTPDEVCTRILDSGILFDQLIREYNSWTHISVPTDPDGEYRKQALIIDRAGTRLFIRGK